MRIITTREEYVRTLDELGALLDLDETEEADRIYELAGVIEAYEREHFPIDPPTVEAILAFRREQRGKR